jgi:hypothetical protein
MPGTDRKGSRRLQWLYLALAVVGFVAPGFVMIRESIRTGNILFWTKPALTTAELFANGTSTAFALDLFGVVTVGLVWMTVESRRLGIHAVWRYWLLTLLFGLAGPLPLCLYARERRLQMQAPGDFPIRPATR